MRLVNNSYGGEETSDNHGFFYLAAPRTITDLLSKAPPGGQMRVRTSCPQAAPHGRMLPSRSLEGLPGGLPCVQKEFLSPPRVWRLTVHLHATGSAAAGGIWLGVG